MNHGNDSERSITPSTERPEFRKGATDDVRLIALDIDGVISKGKRGSFSQRVVQVLAEMNGRATRDKECPAVTVITGRPAPYVEAIGQVLGCFMPAVFEQGTGLFDPDSYVFLSHPDLDNGPAFAVLQTEIRQKIVMTGLARMQLGKEHTISLYSPRPDIAGRLKEVVLESVGDLCDGYELVYSSDSLNILPIGFDKGRGIELLATYTEIPLENTLGVGDSEVDVPFLTKVGYAGAPANATSRVKDAAHYCSREPYGDGLLDILGHFSVLPTG